MFYPEIKKISNQYFTFNHIIDNDTIIVITNNVKFLKGNPVLIIANNKGIYLKQWQIDSVKVGQREWVSAYAVKLNRNFFKPFTFNFDFDDFAFSQEDSFESLLEISKTQNEKEISIK